MGWGRTCGAQRDVWGRPRPPWLALPRPGDFWPQLPPETLREQVQRLQAHWRPLVSGAHASGRGSGVWGRGPRHLGWAQASRREEAGWPTWQQTGSPMDGPAAGAGSSSSPSQGRAEQQPPWPRVKRPDDFKFGKILGKGAFSTVTF